MMSKIHLNIRVLGKVQGVYFRHSTKAVADQLGIVGWVKNESDGSVYIEAEGDKAMMDAFIEWCEEGPERAVVDSINMVEDELKSYNNFIVKK